MRPGGHPMTELAAALIEALGGPQTEDDVALRRAGLERGPLSLIEELRERPLPDSGNLLILVDQFEELLRYSSLAGREEAEAFVALLLTSAIDGRVPIYVVLTMRSDFLGHCAEFDGLAEAVTDAQYLSPRLSREQIAAAVEGPAKVFKGEVEPRLIAYIINDMGTDPDQLPLMQHALMRLWERATAFDSNAPLLRLDDYVAEGGIKGSLSRHADVILAEITRDEPERAETARRLFCLLVEGEGESAVRRLASMNEIVAVTGKSLDENGAVADPFRAPGRSLLMPGLDRRLVPETVLDISHESLIRQWQQLKDWVRGEAASAEQYREIERRARRWATGSAAFVDGTDLDSALA
jgi:Novel STAND NTPase 1